MLVRTATQADANLVVPLILSSGPNSLRAMFGISDQLNADGYIRFAFAQVGGQFGHNNHLVVEREHQAVAVGSYWTHQVSEAFRRATMQSLVSYYGVSATSDVLARSQLLAQIIPSPGESELTIGHIAVSPSSRNQGIGRFLLDHLKDIAKAQGKAKMVLDVEATNDVAIAFYQHYGFEQTRFTEPGPQAQAIGLTAHWHMQLLL